MKGGAIGRRYAKALSLIGKKTGTHGRIEQDLNTLDLLFKEHKLLRDVVTNPIHSKESRKKVLGEIGVKVGLDEVIMHFLYLLIDKDRIHYLSNIVEAFREFADKEANRVRAELVSAVPLPQERVDDVHRHLQRICAKEILLSKSVNEGILGGVVCKVGDVIYDGSVAFQLEKMKEIFRRG